MMMGHGVSGSFRDPAGHVFCREGIYYRQVNHAGREDYERLQSSGLYETLTAAGLLIPHDNLGLVDTAEPEAWTVLRPRQVPFISYPHEWAFSQLRDAALATLEIQRRAMAAGMSLKDANAANIQFVDGRPLLIDTLSLERLTAGPWVGYRQFCQHFLAPLALASFSDQRLSRVSQLFVDGVPLDFASRLLPLSTWLRRGPLLHLHLHAVGERRLAHRPSPAPAPATSRATGADLKEAVIASLRRAVQRLRWQPDGAWKDYYERRESYTADADSQKQSLVAEWLDRARPATLWDLGANTGRFSRLATDLGVRTVAFDQDASCVERMYVDARQRKDPYLLPLVMDLTNPSPAMGWAHEERASLIQRGPAEWVLALAILHHLAIGNNVPLDRIARFMRSVGRELVIEFVPKDDPMVRAMLASRADVFPEYDVRGFESIFSRHFLIERRVELRDGARVLYWMRAR